MSAHQNTTKVSKSQEQIMARAIEILLYVPNLIGYARILLLIFTYWFMVDHYIISIFFYSLSSILDAFDGYYARKLNQSSKFGGLLDMLTDRGATACLCMCLFLRDG